MVSDGMKLKKFLKRNWMRPEVALALREVSERFPVQAGIIYNELALWRDKFAELTDALESEEYTNGSPRKNC